MSHPNLFCIFFLNFREFFFLSRGMVLGIPMAFLSFQERANVGTPPPGGNVFLHNPALNGPIYSNKKQENL